MPNHDGDPRGMSGAALAPMVVVAVVAALVHLGNLGNGFVWDDHAVVLRAGASAGNGLLDLLTKADMVFADEPTPYFRPLGRILLQVQVQAFGPNPVWFHLASLLLHAANAALVWAMGRRLLAGAAGGWAALLAALLFAVHPVQVEAVAFASAQNNLLATIFTLSAWLVLDAEERRPAPWKVGIAALLFFLGLLGKETAALLPFVVLAASRDGWRNIESVKRRVVRLVPLWLAGAAYFALRTTALAGVQAVAGAGPGIGARLAENLYALPKYALLLAWPAQLSAWHAIPPDWATGHLWIYGAWILLLAGAALCLRGGGLPARIGLAWLALNLLPISGIVAIPSAALAERYLYLPMAGIALLVAAPWGRWAAMPRGRPAAFLVGLAALLALGAVSARRSAVWRDDATLFADVTAKEPTSGHGPYNLGNAHLERGDLAAARLAWELAVAREPGHSRALNQLGNLALQERRPVEAEAFYLRAVGADPGNAEAWFNLGRLEEQDGRTALAWSHYQRFLERVPPGYESLAEELRAKLGGSAR